MATLNQIVSCLDKFEENLAQLKTDVEVIGNNQSQLETDLKCASTKIYHNSCGLKDIGFIMDRQEQYSRKSSIRMLKVAEEKDENVEMVCISKIQEELGIKIK